MNKKIFYQAIKNRLKGLKQEEVNNVIDYYDELINEMMDNGYSEAEAISSFGDVEEIVRNIKTDVVIKRSNDSRNDTLKNFLIVLGVCSSPILIPLGIAFFAVFISLLITIVSVFFAFTVSAGAILVTSIYTSFEMIASGTPVSMILIFFGAMLLASSLLCLLSIGVYQIGKIILNFIIHQFSKLVKNKMKKKEIENV